MEHKMRFSDSSMYDEKCVYCGLTDDFYASQNIFINKSCSATPERRKQVDDNPSEGY